MPQHPDGSHGQGQPGQAPQQAPQPGLGGQPQPQGQPQGQPQSRQGAQQAGLVEAATAKLAKLPEKARNKVMALMTPDLAAMMSLFAGPEMGQFIASQANQTNMLKPVPKKVLAVMGEEKWAKMIETALAKAEEMEASQSEANAAPQAGPASAPPPQQAPVTASAPTGQGGFAAGRGLPQDSATAQIVNTPIQ